MGSKSAWQASILQRLRPLQVELWELEVLVWVPEVMERLAVESRLGSILWVGHEILHQ